jgi:radical SAM superfamily enzyme YgiQ (UPF0313 family)
MMVRADTIVKNKNVIAAWKEIGLERVFIGVEGTNDSILKRLNKGTTSTINEEAIKYIQSLKIQILSDFIIPQDFDYQDFADLKKYVRKMKLSSPIFTILTPLPGTPFFREVEDKLIDKQFEHFDVMHSMLKTKLPLREFYKEVYKLYKGSASLYQKYKFLSLLSIKDVIQVTKLYGAVTKKLKILYKKTPV